MACKDCKCKEVKFSCGLDPIVNIVEQCKFPDSYSIDFNMSSRSDCHYYQTQCNFAGTPPFNGIIDCYNRQDVIDNNVKGIYILQKNNSVDQFGNLYLFNYFFKQNLSDVQLKGIGCVFSSDFKWSPEIIFTMTAVQTPPSPTEGLPSMLTYDQAGHTAFLSVRVPAFHTFPSIFPTYYSLGLYGYTPYLFYHDIFYASNQPITCDGPITFTHLDNGLDALGTDAEFTIFPTTLTAVPIL